MTFPKHIKKRDEKIDEFNPFKLKEAISSAVKEIYKNDYESVTDEIYSEVVNKIGESFSDKIPEIEDVIIASKPSQIP